jgi:hypothetical protein
LGTIILISKTQPETRRDVNVMRIPFETTVTDIFPEVTVATAVEVRVPHHGVITRIVVSNTVTGQTAQYTVDIYNRVDYAGSTIGDGLGYGTDTSAGTANAIGKVIPTLTVSAGLVGEAFDVAYPYRNQDARTKGRENNLLHVVITPGHAAQKFDISIAGLGGSN